MIRLVEFQIDLSSISEQLMQTNYKVFGKEGHTESGSNLIIFCPEILQKSILSDNNNNKISSVNTEGIYSYHFPLFLALLLEGNI